MSRELGISKEYVYTYLEYLERAGLMSSLREDARGYRMARKPEKIFMENTNLLCAVNRDLKSESSRGQMRETFFVNQLKGVAKITAGVVGDFTIDGKHHFEVGGKGKTFRQLQGAENGYVVADQIEIGHGNKIPLYLFGFLY
jgi:predicted AAA+ superfamily ATPase